MKKTPRKLVLRSETLRTLADLDLSRAVGGLDSGVATCPNRDVVDSGPAVCEAPAIVAATAVCR
jgi:hypothetical protein